MIKITECEEQVMIVVWSNNEAPNLKIVQADVNKRFNHEWAPQTVSTFLHRLVVKGYLNVTRKGRYSHYRPAVALEDYRIQKMRDVVKILFDDDNDLVSECLSNIQ